LWPVCHLNVTCWGQAAATHTGGPMLAFIAAALFILGLLLDLTKVALGPLDVTVFLLLGLIAMALHMAGVGAGIRTGRR
jgi:hypothetical protein